MVAGKRGRDDDDERDGAKRRNSGPITQRSEDRNLALLPNCEMYNLIAHLILWGVLVLQVI